MKAIVQDVYGSADVLQLREIERPVPGEDEVLVRVRAASVHPDVWHVMTGLPYVLRLIWGGLRRPKVPVPGNDLAGVVESVGRKVTRFAAGDEVFGVTYKAMGWVHGGAYAEYAVAPEEGLALKPPDVTFEEAAAVPTSGVIALPSLGAGGGIEPGQKVLINGAGGGVGSIAVQIAKAFGAAVTGVDHTDKLEMIRSLGADHAIDYTREDFTRSKERYDLIFDVPGNHSLSQCRRALEPDGTYILIGFDHYGKGMRRWVGLIPRMIGLMALSLFVKQLPDRGLHKPTIAKCMELLRSVLNSGKLIPHIDRSFPLDEAPEALRYLQAGRAKGKVVISI